MKEHSGWFMLRPVRLTNNCRLACSGGESLKDRHYNGAFRQRMNRGATAMDSYQYQTFILYYY